NDADEKKETLETARESRDAFTARLRARANEAASAVSSDFPVAMEARTLAYSRISQALAGDTAHVLAALKLYWRAGLDRLDLTRTRSLESRQAQLEDGRSVNAWRLRLGTVFLAELEKEGGGSSQILLRTGSLQ